MEIVDLGTSLQVLALLIIVGGITTLKQRDDAVRNEEDWERKQHELEAERVLARNKLDVALDRIDAWRSARPFLWPGQDVYYRELILEAIELAAHALACGALINHSIIELLYRLLDQDPPPYQPPTMTLPGGVLSFYCGRLPRWRAVRYKKWPHVRGH